MAAETRIVPSHPEPLLSMGARLHAALVIDSQRRIVRIDQALTHGSGWEGKAPEGHLFGEVLGPLSWLIRAVDEAFSGRVAIGAHDGLKACVLPVFEDESLLGVCACLSSADAKAVVPEREDELVRELERTRREHSEFINNIDGIVWEAEPDLRFTFVSQKAERLLGYPARRWVDEPDFWVKHLHPDDREWVYAFCLKATRACMPHELEYRMIAADGRTVWLRDIVTIRSDKGVARGLTGVMVDVTEHRRALDRLERANSLLRATLESTADGVLVTDRNRRVQAFNRNFQALWGFSDALLEKHDGKLLLESMTDQLRDPAAYVARVLELYAHPEAEDFLSFETLDGRILERYSRPQRLGETIIGRVWSFRDVTRRVRTQRERDRLLQAEQTARARLEESLALLDTFLKNAPIGLGFLSPELRYIRLNDALAALHGRRREEEVGHTIREMTPHLAPVIEPLMRRVVETGEPVTGLDLAGEVPSAPGEIRNWRVSYYPVQTPSGGVVGVGAVVVDSTVEHRAQAERERLLQEARDAIRVRDDFLSIVSHELRTPLTPLKLFLERLRKKVASGEKVSPRLLERALAQVGRISELIGDLLDASQIEAGRLEVEHSPVSLRDVVRGVVDDFAAATAQNPLEYEELTRDPLVVLGHRERLAQVLGNLLENAFKYSQPGRPVRVTLARVGKDALVSVSDSGIGIPPDQQPYLFERFFRARNSPISGFGGLGLGLYISRSIVDSHGGRIWVESELGHGATFHVSLPLLSP